MAPKVEETNQDSSILLVDDDPNVVSAVGRHLRPVRPVLGAVTFQQAIEQLESGARLCGAVIDVKLDAGHDGFEVLDRLRPKFPGIPVLILTGEVSHSVLERAYERQARVLPKGIAARHLHRFALRCALEATEEDDAVREALGDYADHWELSLAEVELIQSAMRGRRVGWYLEQGVAKSTYRSRVRHLLSKVGQENLSAIGLDILRTSLRVVRTQQLV